MQIDHRPQDMKFNTTRDSVAAVLGVASVIVGVTAGLPGIAIGALAFAGPAIKKLAIADDSSSTKRFWLGALSLLLGGPTSLIGYWIATPGWKSEHDVRDTRESVASRHI